jgi:hypothetical protein
MRDVQNTSRFFMREKYEPLHAVAADAHATLLRHARLATLALRYAPGIPRQVLQRHS